METVAQITHMHNTPTIAGKESAVASTRQPAAMVQDTPFARDTYFVLHNTLFKLLRQRGRSINGHGLQRSVRKELDDAHDTLMRLCKEFIKIHGREADRNISTLDLSIPMLHQSYHTTVDEMFEETINWGRIIALICFTVAVAEKVHDDCSDSRSKIHIIEDIETWLNAIFYNKLQGWICTAGGWGGLVSKFRQDKVRTSDSSSNGQWLTLTAVGVAGVLVTALLTR